MHTKISFQKFRKYVLKLTFQKFKKYILKSVFINSENKVNKSIEINNKFFKIPNLLFKKDIKKNYNSEIKEALIFNKNLFLENFIIPNRLKFPFFRNILEKYYT